MYPPIEDVRQIVDARRRAEALAERAVVLKLVDTLLAAGFEFAVDDGEERHPWTTDRAAVLDAILNTDEDVLHVRKDGRNGWVLLVYGNSGWDVICDYSVWLEAALEPVTALAEALEPRVERGEDIEVAL